MYRKFLFIMALALGFLGQPKAQEFPSGQDSIRSEKDSIRSEKDSIRTEKDSIRTERDSIRTEKDSIRIVKDSLGIEQDSLTYRAFEKRSQKSKFTRILHGMFFKPTDSVTNRNLQRDKIRNLKSYHGAEGKIIREIHITTLDPFGFHIQDTSMHPRNFFVKAGNSMHLKTQTRIIKNMLLFARNEPYDSLLVNESERLIRSKKYVQDVLFYTEPVSGIKDSVDVFIRVLDVWSTVPAFHMSNATLAFELTDHNLAGMGNSFQGDFRKNRITNENVTRISYLIPNIRKSYININLQYLFSGSNDLIENDEFAKPYYTTISSNFPYTFSGNRGLLKSIELSRTLYSPVAKWAGGVFLGQMITAQSYIRQDSLFYLSSRTNVHDYWAAKSWPLFTKKPADNRTTNLILSARLLRIRYPGRPPEADTTNVFIKENMYFAGIGFASRKYARDTYIFQYGKVEDVPVGRAFGITVGFDVQQTNRWYLGLKAAWGNYYRFGYLSTRIEYGTFMGASGYQQAVVTGRISYFTRLINLGNWKVRQFIRPSLTFGLRRLPADYLTLSDEMKGFGALENAGKHRIVLTLQTQSYAPWNLIGFHFGPYLLASFGMLGNETIGFNHSQVYTILGIGMLIKNDYLMFNTFQISLAFYPILPGKGYNIFKTNAYKTSDFGFRDFEISKPEVVDYR